LGPQFTEKEGERLIARAYNPRLSEKENVKRVRRLIDQIKSAAKAKGDAADYFEKNGTLAGYKGTIYKGSDVDKLLPSLEEDKVGSKSPLINNNVEQIPRINNKQAAQIRVKELMDNGLSFKEAMNQAKKEAGM